MAAQRPAQYTGPSRTLQGYFKVIVDFEVSAGICFGKAARALRTASYIVLVSQCQAASNVTYVV